MRESEISRHGVAVCPLNHVDCIMFTPALHALWSSPLSPCSTESEVQPPFAPMNTSSSERDPQSRSDALFRRLRAGDDAAKAELMTLVYGELKAIARHKMRACPPGHTLQATALVHEACARLLGSPGSAWRDRNHFLALASRSMRHLLIDHARKRRTQKRDPGRERLPFDEMLASYEERSIDLLVMDEALETLAEREPASSQLVELHFFGGQSVEQCAEVLGVSSRTAYRMLAAAKAFLYGAVREDAGERRDQA